MNEQQQVETVEDLKLRIGAIIRAKREHILLHYERTHCWSAARTGRPTGK